MRRNQLAILRSNRIHRPVPFGALVTLALAFAARECHAVAFKMYNETDFKVRARAYDRAAWRDWVEFNANAWGVFAANVERTDHQIQLEVWSEKDRTWVPFYDNKHGSRIFTRVIHLTGSNSERRLSVAWYDEAPGCRDKPPCAENSYKSCLNRSGVLNNIKKAITVAGVVIEILEAGSR